jgi:Co/Zn/Cd efflux system component
LLAWYFGRSFMDPAAGLVGAFVIAAWSFALIRDTGAILLDMTPDRAMAERVRETIEADGDRLTDLHLWRLGPGHLGAILSGGDAPTARGGLLSVAPPALPRPLARHRPGAAAMAL